MRFLKLLRTRFGDVFTTPKERKGKAEKKKERKKKERKKKEKRRKEIRRDENQTKRKEITKSVFV